MLTNNWERQGKPRGEEDHGLSPEEVGERFARACLGGTPAAGVSQPSRHEPTAEL
jgi:hypothetical protein